MQQVDQTARRNAQIEVGPQQVGDLRQRHPHPRVQLHDQRDHAGAELRPGGSQRVGGLQGVAALHPPPALRAVPDLDVEPAHDGAHLGQVLLILRRHAGHFDRAAAVRARRGDRRCVGFVDPRRAETAAVPPVLRTGPPAGPLAVTLRPVLGEGRRLSAAGATRRLQLLFQVVVLALQTVVLAFQAVVLRPSSLMRASRESRSGRDASEPPRLPFSRAIPHVSARVPRTCTPLRGVSHPYPLTKDRPMAIELCRDGQSATSMRQMTTATSRVEPRR